MLDLLLEATGSQVLIALTVLLRLSPFINSSALYAPLDFGRMNNLKS